jgi:hypothetical protein
MMHMQCKLHEHTYFLNNQESLLVVHEAACTHFVWLGTQSRTAAHESCKLAGQTQ